MIILRAKGAQRIRTLAAVTALAGFSILAAIPVAAQEYSPAEIERINREYQQSLQQLQDLKKDYSAMPEKPAPVKAAPAAEPVALPEPVPAPVAAPMAVIVASPPPPPPAPPVQAELPFVIPTPPTVRTMASPPVKYSPAMQESGKADMPASMRAGKPHAEAEPVQEAPAATPALPVISAPAGETKHYPVKWDESMQEEPVSQFVPVAQPTPEPMPAPTMSEPILTEPMMSAPIMDEPEMAEKPRLVAPPELAPLPMPVPMAEPMPVPPSPEPVPAPIPAAVIDVPAVVAHAAKAPEAVKHKPSARDLPASMALQGKHAAVELPPEPVMPESVMPEEMAAIPEAPVALPENMPETIDASVLDDGEAALEDTAPVKEVRAPQYDGPESLMAAPLPEELPEGVQPLSPKTASFLKEIPAEVLSTKPRETIHVHEPITIDRMQASSVFPVEEEETAPMVIEDEEKPAPKRKIGKADPSIRDELGLVVQVRNKDMASFENLKSAREALYAGQFETAITLYKRVLEVEPKSKDALFGLATGYQMAGQLEPARDLYLQLIGIDQNYWPALNNLFILASEEAPEDALRHLQELEKINPHFAPIPAQIAMIQLQKRDFENAARNLGHAAVLDPENMRYRFDLALLMEHIGDTKSAGLLYRQLLDAGAKGKELPEAATQIQARLNGMMAKDISTN